MKTNHHEKWVSISKLPIYFSDFHLNLRRMHMNWCRDFFGSFSLPLYILYTHIWSTITHKKSMLQNALSWYYRRQKKITSRFVINSVLKSKKEKKTNNSNNNDKKRTSDRKKTNFQFIFGDIGDSHLWRGKQYTAYFLIHCQFAYFIFQKQQQQKIMFTFGLCNIDDGNRIMHYKHNKINIMSLYWRFKKKIWK